MHFKTVIALLAILTANVGAWGQSDAGGPTKIEIIGDSTVSNYPVDSNRRGWGQVLPEFLVSNVTVVNRAEGGKSTKTFPKDKWDKVLADKPNFVLIQFGHNDSHPKEQPEATDAATDFRDNLRRYIAEAKAAGITPILVTPVHRRVFDANKHPTKELEPYANAVKIVGQETGVGVVDLYEKSGALFESLGEEGSTPFTLNNTDNADRPNFQDRTHFTVQGAREIARLVAAGLVEADRRFDLVVRKELLTRTAL